MDNVLVVHSVGYVQVSLKISTVVLLVGTFFTPRLSINGYRYNRVINILNTLFITVAFFSTFTGGTFSANLLARAGCANVTGVGASFYTLGGFTGVTRFLAGCFALVGRTGGTRWPASLLTSGLAGCARLRAILLARATSAAGTRAAAPCLDLPSQIEAQH